MKPGADIRSLQKIPAIIRGDNVYTLSLEPFTSVHLHSVHPGGFESGNIDNVHLFSIIAAFVLLIVTFNFANLATAQAVNRIKTIGTHKLLGASRRRLFRQLIGETLLLSLIAFLLAAVTARLLLPAFNQLAGKTISTDIFNDLHRMLALLAGSIFAGIAAGIYPALLLSGYPALTALRESFRPGKSSFVLRRSMVVAQFTLTFILILGTLVIVRQLNYMRSADPGFTPSQLLVLDMRGDERAAVFKQNIKRLPAVISATFSSFSSDIPGADVDAIIPLKLEEAGGQMIDVRWAGCSVDFDYFRTFDIRMAAGRAFSRSLPTDTMQAVIVNETAAHSLGYATVANAIGHRCIRGSLRARVIGVVNDFHTRSFREPIAPLVLWLQPEDHDAYLSIRLSPDA
jgi:putative ABC transport system permease protein